MRELLAAKDAGRPVAAGGSLTVGRWMEQWMADVLPERVAPKTYTGYCDMARYYVIPAVGTMRLVRLEASHVEKMMAGIRERGLSIRTANYARRVLILALKAACRRGLVTQNVAALTDAYRSEGPKLSDRLTGDQADAVLEAVRGDRNEALAVLVLAVGVRQGEALALEWGDIDLTEATLTVRRTTTKTLAGARTIPLPSFVIEALRRHRKAQLEERMAAVRWDRPDLVFPTVVGSVYSSRNILRWWHELTIRAGVGRRRFHASRHTAATLMLKRGVKLEVVSKILGHAGYAITADIYAQPDLDLMRQAADAMDQLFGGRS
jgi:integrase